ncbi:MAG TPA: hypothetical protein VGQ92_20220 [Actinoplanes sp.]|jgi:hypothetical protein|nr:hypothetical protein [Actinoplanes sp.]
MRIKTTVGLGIVGAAAAAALIGGGVAYAAADEPEPRPVVRIVTDEVVGNPAADGRNCPDRSGSGQPAEAGL